MNITLEPSLLDDVTYRRKFIGYIRKLSIWSPERTAVLRERRVEPGLYQCVKCRRLVHKLQCDHIKPVGRQFENGEMESWVRKMLCLRSNLQGLCKECHDKKTLIERNGLAKRRKARTPSPSRLRNRRTRKHKRVRRNRKN